MSECSHRDRAVDLVASRYYKSYKDGDMIPRVVGVSLLTDLFVEDSDTFMADVKERLK